MNTHQIYAILAPLVLLAVMYPIFKMLGRAFKPNWRLGWYFGLAIYWLIWGVVFPWLLIGREGIIRIIHPQQLTVKIFLLLLFPLVLSALFKLVPNMEYDKPSTWIFVLILSTCLGNGIFEELLWRGVYLECFPNNMMFGVIWPSIFFALWYYIPGSVNPKGNVVGLMVGSGLMRFYLAFLARHTGSIWWTIIVHTVGGFITVL
jgi:membrane protease YdiL (CAAX protease family)